MGPERARIAARNNAVWCDAVCRARRGATAFVPGLWWQAAASPPYFPALVTLSAAVGEEGLMPALQGRHDEFAIKDSFCRLDLHAHGFKKLFEARWLWRAPRPAARAASRLRWTDVDTPALLERWAAAWWPEPGAALPDPAVFGPALLDDPAVGLLAGFEGERLVAGCAVTRSDDVAGLSCCFLPPEAGLREEMLDVVQARHPGRALVSYDQGEVLQALLGLGFEAVGPLQVWLGRVLPR